MDRKVEELKCVLCGKQFACTGNLHQHIRSHTKEKNFQCGVCHVRYSCRRDLRHHEMKKHQIFASGKPPKIYKCSMCEIPFYAKDLLKRHLLVHNNSKPFNCDVCKKSFKTKYTLKAHMKQHEDTPRKFNCSLCAKNFLTNGAMQSHILTHTGEKPFKCHCGKSFRSTSCLKIHKRTHEYQRERLFKCGICGSSALSKSNLNSHIKTVHSGQLHKCEECKRVFKTANALTEHTAVVHNSADLPFRCVFCNRGFLSKGIFFRHLTCHVREKPFTCSVCGKPLAFYRICSRHKNLKTNSECRECKLSFNSKYLLNQHLSAHHNLKPFKCDVCKKTFKAKYSLKLHINEHTGIKFDCSLCEKKFLTKYGLECHMRCHTGEKPFICQCGQSFRSNSYLKDHKQLHEHPEKILFKCSICSNSYKSKYYLSKHLKVVHNSIRMHSCQLCGKTFKTQIALKEHHTRVHHRKDCRFWCVFCSQNFYAQAELFRHLRGHIHEKPISCPVCGKSFGTHTGLVQHMESKGHFQKK